MDEELICPIDLELLNDPITLQECCGRTFSRVNLIQAFNTNGKKCPLCSHPLPNLNPDSVPKNIVIANIVETYIKKINDDSGDNLSIDPWTITCNILNKELDKPQPKTTIAKLDIICNHKSVIKKYKTLLLLVVDCSGSMSGKPINQAKLALAGIMNKTKKNDAIIPYILGYNHTVMKYNDPSQINAGGGTCFEEAFNGIVTTCKQYNDKVQNIIVVFLTDGCCGNSNSQKIWTSAFEENLSKVCNHPRVIHTIGFGSNHDFNFLNSIRELGTVEGSYRYADPSEDDDILFSKINSVTDTIVGSSIVPISVEVGEKLFKVDLINQKATCWVHTKPKSIIINTNEFKYEINVNIEETCDINLWVKWYSYLTDNIINETIQMEHEKATLDKDNIEIYGELLLRRCSSIIKALTISSHELDDEEKTENPELVINRLSYVMETIKQLMNGRNIDKFKLTDVKYEGQFTTKTDKKTTQSQHNPLVAHVPKINVNICLEPTLVPLIYKERTRSHLVGSNAFPYISQDKNDTIDITCGNNYDSEHSTVLSFAASIGRCTVVKKFLEHDSSKINFPNDFGETPLDRAVLHGHWHTVQILIDYNATFNFNSSMLLHTCLNKGYYNTAQKMVSNDKLIVTQDDLQYFSDPNIASWIMNNIKVDDKTRDLTTIQKGIVDNLPKFSMKSYEFKTYPNIFTEPNEGHIEIITYLLENKISSPNEEWVSNDDIVWPLFLACEKGCLSIVNILLDYCQDIINKQTKKGTTCLWIASCTGCLIW